MHSTLRAQNKSRGKKKNMAYDLQSMCSVCVEKEWKIGVGREVSA